MEKRERVKIEKKRNIGNIVKRKVVITLEYPTHPNPNPNPNLNPNLNPNPYPNPNSYPYPTVGRVRGLF